jgi:hypothetical protein
MTQGATGIDNLKDAAIAAGAVMDDVTKEKFAKLDEVMKTTAQTAAVFYAEFAAPLVNGLIAVMREIQRLQASFEKLSQQMKINTVVASFVTALLFAEGGIRSINVLLKGTIFQELLGGFLSVTKYINIVVVALASLYFAFQTNFANVKSAVQPVVAAFQDQMFNMYGAMTMIGQAYDQYMKPAFEELSRALAPLVESFGQFIAWLIATVDPVNRVRDAIIDLIVWFSQMVTWFDNHRDTVKALAAAFVILAGLEGIGAAIKAFQGLGLAIAAVKWETMFTGIQTTVKAFNALKGAIIGAAVWEAIAGGVRMLALAYGLGGVGGLIAGIWGAVAGFIAEAAAATAAFIALNIATLGIAALIGGLVAAAIYLPSFADQFDAMCKKIDLAIANAEIAVQQHVAAMLRWIGDAASKIFGVGAPIVSWIEGLAHHWDDAAKSAQKYLDKQAAAEKAKMTMGTDDGKGRGGGFGPGQGPASPKYYPAEGYGGVGKDYGTDAEGAPGAAAKTTDLGDPKGKAKAKGAPDTTGLQLKKITDELTPLTEAIKAVDAYAAHLGRELSSIGPLDTIDNEAQAMRIYGKEITNSDLATTLLNEKVQKSYEITAQLEKLKGSEKGKRAAADQEEINGKLKEQADIRAAAGVSLDEEHYKRIKYSKDELAAQLTLAQTNAADVTLTQSQRVKAEEVVLSIMQAQGDNANKILTQKQAILKATEQDAIASRTALTDAANTQIARNNDAQKLRDAQSTGPDPSGLGAQAKTTADALTA